MYIHEDMHDIYLYRCPTYCLFLLDWNGRRPHLMDATVQSPTIDSYASGTHKCNTKCVSLLAETWRDLTRDVAILVRVGACTFCILMVVRFSLRACVRFAMDIISTYEPFSVIDFHDVDCFSGLLFSLGLCPLILPSFKTAGWHDGGGTLAETILPVGSRVDSCARTEPRARFKELANEHTPTMWHKDQLPIDF